MASSLYSDQITNLRAGTLNDGSQAPAVFPFSYTVPTATIAAGDTLFLTLLPKGFKPALGYVSITAGGAAATAEVGIWNADSYALVDADEFGDLTDMTLATAQYFANTRANGLNVAIADDYFMGLLTAAQAIQAAATLDGWIMGRL